MRITRPHKGLGKRRDLVTFRIGDHGVQRQQDDGRHRRAADHEQVGDRRADHDADQQQGAEQSPLRHEQQDRAQDFKTTGEIAKPLAEADMLEFLHQHRNAIELGPAGRNKGERNQPLDDPKANRGPLPPRRHNDHRHQELRNVWTAGGHAGDRRKTLEGAVKRKIRH
jgi:hypothetical protein